MPDTTTTSTTTTTTGLPSKPMDQLLNFIDVIYPKYILNNNKFPFDIIKLGISEVFSLVQTEALPTWLDIETAGIKGIPGSNDSNLSYITIINYKEPEFLNTKITIFVTKSNLQVEQRTYNITKNNEVFTLAKGETYEKFYITKQDTIKGLQKTIYLYYYNKNGGDDASKNYQYTINNAYCDVYERTGVDSRIFKGTFPIFKIPDADRINYKLVVDIDHRDLFSIDKQNLISTENYQLEPRFKNTDYVLEGSYSYLTKLPTDYLIIGNNLIEEQDRNASSLETITETLVLLAKLKYANKKSGINYVENYFTALLNTVKTLPRLFVSNDSWLFYSKYTFDETNEKILIHPNPSVISKISVYPNLYMACRFLESKDPDLVNFVHTSGLLNGIFSCVEINQNVNSEVLNFDGLIREGFYINVTNGIPQRSSYNPVYTLKDQILLYVLYNYLQQNSLYRYLQDRINLLFNKPDFTVKFYVTESEILGEYSANTLDYIWADYFYSSLNLSFEINDTATEVNTTLNTQISSWLKSQLINLEASLVTFSPNIDYSSVDYNEDYDINFSSSPYPKTAYTYSSQTNFAYTPFTIIYHYLQRTAVQGNFLNNYETANGVILANRGNKNLNIRIAPSLFSTVMQILSKIAPSDYFALKTNFLTKALEKTSMLVNYYPVTNGILVTVNLQHNLGLVAMTLSTDGASVFDKKIITTPSNVHSFVLNAPKSSAFILNVNPIIQTE